MNPKTGRMECVFVNLEAVYRTSGRRPREYCLEEIRARGVPSHERPWDIPSFQHVRKIAEPSLNLSIDPLSEPEPPMAGLEQQVIDLSINEAAPTTAKKQRAFAIYEDVPSVPTPERPRAKAKQRGFAIFEDEPAQTTPPPVPQQDEKITLEIAPQTVALNDENNENAPPQTQKDMEKQLRREQRREEKANRTRKIQVMDVKHIKNETKTIQLNLDSPTGPKIKRKKSSERTAEPTMTINTKEAMDEIYGIFNQPLPSQVPESEAEEDDSEDDYTTGDESTGTGKLSGPPSEYGDDTRNELLVSHRSADAGEDGRTDETGWSDFTTSKHVPKEAAEIVEQSTQSTSWDVDQDEKQNDPTTPDELHADDPQTRYVPLPPEDYEPPQGQYRDMAVMANNRLPFMTPIVEQTETSLGASTVRSANREYFHAKTPSRTNASIGSLAEDLEPGSSPFQDVTSEIDIDKRQVLQPIRTKSTKGTISLGQGSAKSQIAAQTAIPFTAEPVQKGPIIQELQCNPMDPQLRATILSQMRPSLSSFEGYFEHLDQTSSRTSEIRKYIKANTKATKGSTGIDKTASTLSLPPMLSLEGAAGKYAVRRQLGAGTFAPVYLAENVVVMAQEEGDSNMADRLDSPIGKSTHRRPLEAIKMEDPPSSWEFYILQLSHRRLGVSRAAESIVRAHEMHLFRDECFLVEEYRDQGTLLDLVNLARVDGGSSGGMDEMMAMWLTIELLRTTEALHSKSLIHGDLKGDNVLVRFDDPGTETDWSPTYFANGAHGWAAKGVCLIDFGRGIDTKHFVPNVGFIADWKTTEADCAEMRELRPWTFQIDYHGLAGIIHSLLFGKYMETIGEKSAAVGQGATKTYRIRESLKRYWQTEIWSEVFDLLLNPLAHLQVEEGQRMPVLRSMRTCRERMEAWLEEHCERGSGLKAMIGRMESAIKDRRRRSVKAG
nr:checkpoint serine/threonine-protein kinase bub1 [Quercus suber]